MKKAVNVTLGGLVFAVEQDAYDALSLYLEQIKTQLSSVDDKEEIMTDIESAMAEKFIQLHRNEKMAITAGDVATIKLEMGEPADFNPDAGSKDEPITEERDGKRRLYRDTDDVIIAGVASGLAKYFDVDPVFIRIAFVVSIFFNGFGLLAYLILWLVVTPAKTTAEKFAMSGDKVNLKEISERVKKNLNSFEGPDKETARSVANKTKGFFDRVFSLIGVLVKALLRVGRYVVGVLLVVGGALATAGLVTVYSVVLLSEKVLLPTEVQTALEILMNNTIGILAISASFVMMLIPLLVLIMAGTSLLVKRNVFTPMKAISLAVVWIVALVLAFTTSILQAEQVMQEVGPLEDKSYELNIDTNKNGTTIEFIEN